MPPLPGPSTPGLTPAHGVLLLVGFGAVMFALTVALSGAERADKEAFLVANRRTSVGVGALSIAATWIWAPALFVSSQQAYQHGVAGVFWFVVPNVAALVLFGCVAVRIRRGFPEGYTLPQLIEQRYGPRVHAAYLVGFLGLQLCSLAVQLVAGALAIERLTGLSYTAGVVGLALVLLPYSLVSGLRASLVTDVLQMVMILGIVALAVPWTVSAAGGWSAIEGGLRGVNRVSGVFDAKVAWSYGVVMTLGLLAGPLGDQMHWQRAFALPERSVRPAFLLGAAVFAVVPLALALLGFVAASRAGSGGWVVADPQLAGYAAVERLGPSWLAIGFVVMLLCGLASTGDSALCAASSLVAVDLHARYLSPSPSAASTLRVMRWTMVALSVLAVAIAWLRIPILWLFLFYGSLRAAYLLPTLLTLYAPGWVDARGMLAGVVGALVLGLPVFVYGAITKQPDWQVAGTCTIVALSGTLAVVLRARRRVEPPAPVEAPSS